MWRTRRHVEGDVQLNVTAMLDMAFQILFFFVLTYRAAPVEGCIAVRMPPPVPVTKPGPGSDAGAPSPELADSLPGVETLSISVTAKDGGAIGAIRVAEQPAVATLADFEERLHALMSISNVPFEQVLLKVSPALQYENVLKVIEVCARTKLTAGEQTKLSIVELP
jgi:biopolymer transport protein ExbD